MWLLWPSWRSFRNASRSRDGRGAARYLLFGLLGLGFMTAGFLGARWLFQGFLQVEFLAELLIRRVLGMVLMFFSGLLVFSSLIGAFSWFYLADDLPLLVTSPIDVRRLFIARLLGNWVQSSWMMLVFALPLVAGCGPVLGAPPWFYPALALTMLPFTFVCCALGTSLAIVLAFFMPARRTQDVLVVLTVLAFLVVYLAVRLAEPERFLDPEGFDRLVTLIADLKTGQSAFFPGEWLVSGIFGVLRDERPSAAGLPVLVLFSAAPALAYLGAGLASVLYFRSYSHSQEGRAETSEGRLSRLVALFGLGRRRAAEYTDDPIVALRRRDSRIFFRTMSQWTQLLLIAALVLVYVFNFRHFRTLLDAGQVGPTFLFFLNFLLGGFVTVTLAARFLYPAISLEGRAVWSLQSAPIDPTTLLEAKLRWGFVPLVLVSLTLTVSSAVLAGAPPLGLLGIGLLSASTTWALSGLAVGLGGAEPQFHEPNPARIASGVGGVVFMLLGMAYLVAVTALLVSPVGGLTTFATTGFVPSAGRLFLQTGLFVGFLGLTVLTHWLPTRLAARKLRAI